MKHKWIALLVILGLLLNTGTALAHNDHPISFRASPPTLSALAVKIATPEPDSIDPALATDFTITNQLFSGLTRIDPLTRTPIPDLAASWSMAPGAAKFTFTLRSGLKWSNGTSVTANDVKYGILRSLDPATGSDNAYMLFAIQNAAEYNHGTITDPDLVGVTVLSSTELQFTLKGPASYFPAVLAMPVSYPVPAATISSWGPDWTEASHIVTSGPYRLTEWVHDDHMLLDKFASFYAAANVQIQQVSVQLVDEMAAWNLFLNGNLDTVTVPLSEVGYVNSDPELKPLLHSVNVPSTYYYGFSLSQPPFNDPLVRKAFIAATDREGLLDTVFGGGNQLAQTFTPAGVFGHVDGVSEGVGIPYNPSQAQQWLREAGYPNGEGLPPVTLWFNTAPGHQSIAEYIQGNWTANLNVTVTLQSLPFEDYIAQIDNGDFQIWRMGWIYDYNDAYNFLYDGVVPNTAGRFGGWSNATYANLLDQAAQSDNTADRQLYYKQAEEILVETDAVMMPLYYITSPVVTRAFLQRPYSSEMYIRDWHISTTTKKIASTPTQDGWVLESGEATNTGGTLNSTATTFYLGDTAQKKQYRSILSFSTKSLPDNAVITRITLKVRKQGIIGGGNPVNAFQGFIVDIKQGFFGSSTGLLASDFQAKATKTYGPTKPALTNGWYSINLTQAQPYINNLATNGGVTQIRLRFKLDDNNNSIANYLSLYSGNAPAASRPQLIIEYYVP